METVVEIENIHKSFGSLEVLPREHYDYVHEDVLSLSEKWFTSEPTHVERSVNDAYTTLLLRPTAQVR